MRQFGLVAVLLCGALPALAQETGSERSYGPVASPSAPATKVKPAPVKPAAKLDAPKTPVAISSEFAEEYGWQVVDDATGVRIGLPTKMVTVPREGRHGSLWASRHNTVRVETFRITDGTTLASLYENERKNSRERQIEHSVSRPDSFFVHGLQGQKLFSMRAFVKNNEIRGFTVWYDQAMAGIVAPVAAVMANTFVAFPAPVTGAAYASGKSVDDSSQR